MRHVLYTHVCTSSSHPGNSWISLLLRRTYHTVCTCTLRVCLNTATVQPCIRTSWFNYRLCKGTPIERLFSYLCGMVWLGAVTMEKDREREGDRELEFGRRTWLYMELQAIQKVMRYRITNCILWTHALRLWVCVCVQQCICILYVQWSSSWAKNQRLFEAWD